MRSLHSAAVLEAPLVGLVPSRSSFRRPAAPVALLPTVRATLDGLEVSESTWDEWVACEARRQGQLAASGAGDSLTRR